MSQRDSGTGQRGKKHGKGTGQPKAPAAGAAPPRLPRRVYETELFRLQAERVEELLIVHQCLLPLLRE